MRTKFLQEMRRYESFLQQQLLMQQHYGTQEPPAGTHIYFKGPQAVPPRERLLEGNKQRQHQFN